MKNKLLRLEKKFLRKLIPIHKQFSKNTFHKIMRKSSTLRSSLKKRSREYNVLFNISLDELRNKFYKAYGKECRYCNTILTVKNIVCDHLRPISNGGKSVYNNLQMICKSCNTRKGNLSHHNFIKLLRWLNAQPEELRKYVLRRLAKGGKF